MKFRLEGTKLEIEWAIASLKKCYSISNESKFYLNRDGKTYRCYLDLHPFFVVSDSALHSKINLNLGMQC
jgi:hypothetical protein